MEISTKACCYIFFFFFSENNSKQPYQRRRIRRRTQHLSVVPSAGCSTQRQGILFPINFWHHPLASAFGMQSVKFVVAGLIFDPAKKKKKLFFLFCYKDLPLVVFSSLLAPLPPPASRCVAATEPCLWSKRRNLPPNAIDGRNNFMLCKICFIAHPVRIIT